MSNSANIDFGELWQQIVQGKDVLRASQYTLVASATFFIYDIILTFQDELELVWRRSLWTFPALLYIGNRYITLACILLTNYQVSPFRPAISKSFCKEGVTVVGFSVGVASWGGIMALRVAALWKTKRWVVWVVWLSWLVTVIALTAGALVVYISSLPTLMYNPVYGACTAMTTTHVQTALPAIQAIFVLILTFLTFAKAYQFPSRLRRLKDVSKLMVLLLRDGTLCFIVVASLSLISGVSWMILPGTASPSRVSMFVYLNWSIFSTIVARLFLRLRKMFYRAYAPSGNLYSPSVYSTTIAWNVGSGYIDHVIEHDVSRFFQDEEFAILSILDPGDAETFLPSLDVHLRMGPLSPTLGRRFFCESASLRQRDRPRTAGSSRPHTGVSARQAHASNGPRPQTGSSTHPQTAQGVIDIRP